MKRPQARRAKSSLKEISTRPFDGGLNVVDSELNLSSRFATHLDNMYRGIDGMYRVRGGTKAIANLQTGLTPRAFNLSNVSTTNGQPTVRFQVGSNFIATDGVSGFGRVHKGATISVNQNSSSTNLVTELASRGITFAYDKNYVVTAVDAAAGHFTVTFGTNASATATINIVAPLSQVVLEHSNRVDAADVALQPTSIVGITEVGTATNKKPMILVVTMDAVYHVDFNLNRIQLLMNDRIYKGLINPAGSWNNSGKAPVSFATWEKFTLIATEDNKLAVFDPGTGSPITGDNADANGAIVKLVQSAAGSTVYIPQGNIVATGFNRAFVAGDPNNKSTLYISEKDTFTQFFGETLSTKAINVNFGRIVDVEDSTITGVHIFHENVIVTFKEAVVVCQITDTDTGPSLDVVDILYGAGCMSNNAAVFTGDDMYLADSSGVIALRKSLYSGVVRNNQISQNISPIWRPEYVSLNNNFLGDTGAFGVFFSRTNQYLFIKPYNYYTQLEVVLHAKVFVYSTVPNTQEGSWSTYSNWAFQCGTVTQDDDLLFGLAWELFLYKENDYTSELSLTNFGEDYLGTAHNFIYREDTPIISHLGISNVRLNADGTLQTKYNPHAVDLRVTLGLVAYFYALPSTDFGEKARLKTIKHLIPDFEGYTTFWVFCLPDGRYNRLGNSYYSIFGLSTDEMSWPLGISNVKVYAPIHNDTATQGYDTTDALQILATNPLLFVQPGLQGTIVERRTMTRAKGLTRYHAKGMEFKFVLCGLGINNAPIVDKIIKMTFLYSQGGRRR